MSINEKLSIIHEFQTKYPDAHVGGSIGLFLHGIDLKRDLSNSDIDITLSSKIDEQFHLEQWEESSDNKDYDYSFRCYNNARNHYSKIDIRVNPEPSFVIVNYDSKNYNVSKLRDIIFWKQKYANKGVQKHIDDIVVINGGERPVVKEYEYSDDLPF